MALVSRLKPQRIDIPNEPGEWVEIKPLTAGIAIDVTNAGMKPADASIAILLGVVTNWSYPAPVNEESLRDLDSDTFAWLQTQLNIASGVRSDAEKNGSNGSYVFGSEPAAVSLTSSDI